MIDINSSEKAIEIELNYLKSKKILQPDDLVNDILYDHNDSKEWADGFWRRRTRHESRIDPEIEIVFESNPSSVLEIGAGYGRILKKLSQERAKRNLNTELFGIEKCKYLEPYFKKFQANEHFLANVKIFYDNFFHSTQLVGKYFDTIVLPMNTFPSFGPDELRLLFKSVKEHIADQGRFIFTSYKIPENESQEKLMKENYSGEILLEEGETPIILEVYQFKKLLEHYGIERINYLIYYHFNDYYLERKKYIYRKSEFLSRKEQIKQIVKENGFNITDINVKSHSLVYVCMKEE